MISLAKLSIRRPKTMLAIWFGVAAVLTLIGLGVSSTLSPTITVVPGTQSSRAEKLANAQFGPTQLVPILLEGPKAQLDRQGPKLVVALTKRPHTRALSAWDSGTASAGLRPKPAAATIVVSVDRPESTVVRFDQPAIERLVSQQVKAPIRAYVTGQPSIDRAEKNASLSNLRRNELIGIGILFLLLLVGLRTPVAALLVSAIGTVSVLAGFGEVALLGHVLSLDPVGVAAGTMTGLAVAVGFALMILDRFHREEFAGGRLRSSADAATRELAGTGRAVLVAGTALIIALAVVAVVGPSELMISVGTGALACAAFATGGAVVVMPAALVLLGTRVDAFSFPAPRPLVRMWNGLVAGGNRVIRHAVYAGFAATALLLAIAVPALSLQSGPPDVSQLPAGSSARIAFQEVSRVMGPGWPTPYNMIVVARNRPITDPAFLASVAQLQKQIAKSDTVDSVSGPGAINATSIDLKKFGPGIRNSVKLSKRSKKDLLKLINGLGQAGSGSEQLKAGLLQAVSGADQLHGGSGQAKVGAAALHAGLLQANSGSLQLSNGLNQALSGAQALRSGASQALAGSAQLTAGLGQASTPVQAGLPAIGQMASVSAAASSEIKALSGQSQSASAAASNALAALQGLSAAAKGDPNYGAVVSAITQARDSATAVSTGISAAGHNADAAALLTAGMKAQVEQLAPGLDKLHAGAAQLQAGIAQLRDGNAQLAGGISQLANGGGQLKGGLGQLTSGAGQLEAGLALLDNGTGQLASGLTSGPVGAGQLASGIGIMQAAVTKSRGQIPSTKDLEKLFRESPGIFSSGYFVLAAVEGSQPTNRNAAMFTINLLRGGTAGQILVVPKYQANDLRTRALGTQLAAIGSKFGATHNAQVAVGGPAGNLGDLTSMTKSRFWLAVAAVSVAVMLVLIVAIRSLVLPVVATAFGLLVSAATFGVLQLLFGGSKPLLDGPGYLDPITTVMVFAAAFTTTMVFAIFELMRTREAYVAMPDVNGAVAVGLRETAAACTGAGLVMVAAVLPFSTTEFLNVRALGIGSAVAALLAILVVRPVLLPAAEAVLGRFGWWPTRAPKAPHGDDSGQSTRRIRTPTTRHLRRPRLRPAR